MLQNVTVNLRTYIPTTPRARLKDAILKQFDRIFPPPPLDLSPLLLQNAPAEQLCPCGQSHVFSFDTRDYLKRIIRISHGRSSKSSADVVCIGCPASLPNFEFLDWDWTGLPSTSGMQLLKAAHFIIVAAPIFLREFYSSHPPLLPSPTESLVWTLSAVRCENPQVWLLMMFPFLHARTVLNHFPDLQMMQYRSDEKFRIFTNLPSIPSPQEAGYLLCLDCNDWMFWTSKHCKLCGACHLDGFRPWVHRSCNGKLPLPLPLQSRPSKP